MWNVPRKNPCIPDCIILGELVLKYSSIWHRIMLRSFGTVGDQLKDNWKNAANCSAEDSMFSRLCHVTLITFPKVLQLIEGYVWTIWNRLESVFRLLKKFHRITSEIPCFPENLVTGKISLRIRYDSYTGIFRPFRTISEVFEKIPRNFRRRFRVFQIVSFKVKRCSDVPQIDTE